MDIVKDKNELDSIEILNKVSDFLKFMKNEQIEIKFSTNECGDHDECENIGYIEISISKQYYCYALYNGCINLSQLLKELFLFIKKGEKNA